MGDRAHDRPSGTAYRNFHKYRSEMVEGEDYFEVPREIWSKWGSSDAPRRMTPEDTKGSGGGYAGPLIVMTQTGYLMLTKPFHDKLAWEYIHTEGERKGGGS